MINYNIIKKNKNNNYKRFVKKNLSCVGVSGCDGKMNDNDKINDKYNNDNYYDKYDRNQDYKDINNSAINIVDKNQIERYNKKIIDICKLKGFSKETNKIYKFYINKYLNFVYTNSFKININSVKYYLISLNISNNSARIIHAAIKFFFKTILKINFENYDIPIRKKEKKLPKIISKEKIIQIIDSITNIKHKLIIKILYSSGIRLNEIINLKRKHIDFDRNLINIINGKGGKDRITLLSQSIKIDLLKYYSNTNFKTEYIFEGRKGKYNKKTIQNICKQIGQKYKVQLHPHMLRHCFATHLLDNGIDIKYIKDLLGHDNIETTLIYLKTTNKNISNIKSPLDF